MAGVSLCCSLRGSRDWRGRLDGRRKLDGRRSKFDLSLGKTGYSSLSEPSALSEAAHTKLGELVPVRSLGEFELKGFEGKRAFFAF